MRWTRWTARQVCCGPLLERIGNRFAADGAASLLLLAALSLFAAGLDIAIFLRVETAGFVGFLPIVMITAYLAGPNYGYCGLAVDALLVGYFVALRGFIFPGAPISAVSTLALFIVSGIATIEFMRLLDRAINSLEKEGRRAAALAEQRQILITELAHRTSNNFQLVAAMLTLARRGMTDRTAQTALTEASDRVFAMSIVQRRLLQKPESGVELDAFLRIFCADLAKALGVPIAYRGERLQAVESQTLSSLALIVQEFASNAVKHGAQAGAPVTLMVRIEKRQFARAAVIVEDDGKGLPPDFRPGQSIGLTLVRSFAQSIAGSFDIQNQPNGSGVIATVEFPLPDSAPLIPPIAADAACRVAPALHETNSIR